MAVRYGESAYIYGLHDRGGEDLMLHNGTAKGWVLVTEEIRANPNDKSGRSYKSLADKGFGVIVRLNHAYGNEGTIPHSSRYDNFAERAANFVQNSPGCHIWLIGNEMNLEREQPRGERITPRRYAECYLKCRAAIKSLPGHQNDQVVVGAIGPWNGETPYEADPLGKYPANKIPGAPNVYPTNGFYGDYIKYYRDMLVAIGPENCDALAVHAYSHGYNADLVFNDGKMDAPFQRYYYHFRTYRDQMNAIPFTFRHLPVYLTEANGDANPDGSKWPNVNSGWIKNAYQEINTWNEAGNQQIRCVILYRWSRDDDWHIEGKQHVHEDFREAIARNYRWNPDVTFRKTSVPAIEIQDISASLPTNPDLPPYPTRTEEAIRRFVINHTATPASVTPLRIAQFQTTNQSRPRAGIAYHYCVTATGEVYQTQPLTVASDHAGEFSADSVGVCLIGDFTNAPPPPTQLDAAAGLMASLAVRLNIRPDSSTIAGYSDLAITASPGATWPTWKEPLIEQTNSMMGPPEPGYLARYIDHNTPASVTANQTVTVSLLIQNAGIFTWVKNGANPFNLGFKWLNAQNQEVAFPPNVILRTPLPADVAPKQTVRLIANLQTPPIPGTYRLHWDMVHEHITWFADQGDPGLTIDGIIVQPGAVIPVTPGTGTTDSKIEIQDISATLPTNPNLPPYPVRDLSAIQQIVINHTATPASVTPLRIAQFQTTNEKLPRPGIAYHYCVTADGEVYQTNPLTAVANHAGEYNAQSVGICLIGNFTDAPPPQAQLSATAELIARIAAQLGLAVSENTVFGYSDLAVTASPGATWPTWKPVLIAEAKSLLRPTDSIPPIDIPPGTGDGKIIEHYMLFWRHNGTDWAEWDLVSAIDYIGTFGPTIGFSVEEARRATYVTIVGGPGGVPTSVEQTLKTAGCRVERLDGATQEETNALLYDLVAAGKRFRTLS